MSVIQTIRNRYGKIAGAVIAIALIGFIVSDARNGSFANLFRGHDSSVMKVDGKKVESIDFQKRVKEFEILNAVYNQKTNLDENQRAQMNEQMLSSMAYEAFVDEQCEKLGLTMSDEELKEVFYGMNANSLVRSYKINGNEIFLDPQTHQFNPANVKEFEKELAQQGDKIDPDGKIREQWAAVKDYVQRSVLTDKFGIMFGSSIYAPGYVAKRMLDDEKTLASIKYVKVPYTSVSDNEVKVIDEDLNNYIKKHPGQFYNDQPTRSIEYVSFNIQPSGEDTTKALGSITEMKADFGTTKDNKSFVGSRSDEPDAYTEMFFNKKTFTTDYADSMFDLPVGTVYGPYYENGGYNLTKIVDRQTLPDSVKCRHILVKFKDRGNEVLPDSIAKRRIDSIVTQIKAGVPFDTMVVRCSDDNPEMNKKGGVYEVSLQQRPGFVKEFGDFIFSGKTGETKVVKVDNPAYSGYHYIEILDQKGIAPAIKIATVCKKLDPSTNTQNFIFGKANEFAEKFKSGKDFDEGAKKMGLDKRLGVNVKVSNFIIPGVGPARDVVKWMYDDKTNVGDVSQVFNLNNQRFIIAKLLSITPKGIAALGPENRAMIEQKVKEEKKVQIIRQKYASVKNIDELATQLSTPVQEFDSLKFGSMYIPEMGYESKVTGYAFCPTFQLNTLSPGIAGQGGVYYIVVLNRTHVEDPNALQTVMQQRRMQEMQTRNYMAQMLQQVIMNKADIKYNPANF